MNPATMTILLLAAILYTYAVFSGRKQGLGMKQFLAFAVGFSFDCLGTFPMVLSTFNNGTMNSHVVFGCLALIGMGIHTFLAARATFSSSSNATAFFHKVSLYIYFIWMMSLVTGAIWILFLC
ncbi:MAG: HsmA family protein [Candidatus Kariarchaeaceae archaeon]